MKRLRLWLMSLCILSLSGKALAAFPVPWQIGFQEAASPVMQRLVHFHYQLLYVVYGTVFVVFCLLAYVCIRFRAKRNPIPSKVTHNTLLEVIWTTIPIIILIIVSVPSMRVLYYEDTTPPADMTLKVVGHQWYWEYQYPDHGGFQYDSYLIKDNDLKEGQVRLLAVDNEVVLPVGKVIRILMTSADVIHAWAVPALGLKTDTVPGRVNETWVTIDKPGVYSGQCSELCGIGHGFMPIIVRAVSEEEFIDWIEKAKKQYSQHDAKQLASLATLN
jgi:cytochrome c oxidase subunit 2